MNGEEFRSIELLRLKYSRGDKIIQTFSKIGFPEKLGPLSLITKNFKALGKTPLNHEKLTEMQ